MTPAPASFPSSGAAGPKGPVFVVHDLAQAVAALQAASEAGRAVVLRSPAEGAGSLGPLYFREMIETARQSVPGARFRAELDCGAKPGLVLAALRTGLKHMRVAPGLAAYPALADIARQMDADVTEAGPDDAPLLDLGRVNRSGPAAGVWLDALS